MDTDMSVSMEQQLIIIVAITTAFFMGWWRGRRSLPEVPELLKKLGRAFERGLERAMEDTVKPCRRCEQHGNCYFGILDGEKSEVVVFCPEHCPGCGGASVHPVDQRAWGKKS